MRTARQDIRTAMGLGTLALVALAASLFWGCASGGGGIPPAPPPPAPVVTFAVAVTDAHTGAAVADARVDVQWTATEDDGRTNADGYWSTLAPAFVGFIVEIHADGFDTASVEIPPLADNLQRDVALTPQPPTHPSPLVGRLRLAEGCFRDDTGCLNPIYAHAGDLFSVFTRDEPRALAELDAIAAAGYLGLRTWSTLGGPYWAGSHVGDYVTPDYPGAVRRFFAAVAARHLRLVWSQGDIGYMRDRAGTMGLFAQLDAEFGVIDFIDCGNEAWQTGEPDRNRLAQCVGYYQRAGGQGIRSLTSPPGEETGELDAYSIDPAQVFDVHSYRDGHWYDKRRHIFSITYEGAPRRPFGIGSEPPGNGALVSVTANKHELDDEAIGLLAAASALARQAFVWFSGEGVRIQAGLATQSGFANVPKVVQLLPRDVMTYRVAHHSGTSWRGTRVLAVPNDEVRVDGRMSDDGRFAYTIDGPSGSWRFPVERSFTGRVCDPGPATCQDVSRNAGETLEVAFTRGRLFVGQVR